MPSTLSIDVTHNERTAGLAGGVVQGLKSEDHDLNSTTAIQYLRDLGQVTFISGPLFLYV